MGVSSSPVPYRGNALIYRDEELVFLINERLPTDRPCLGIQ